MNSIFSKITAMLIISLCFAKVKAQEIDNGLSEEQYKVIESLFSNRGIDFTIYYQTIDFKSWIELIDLRFKQNTIPCSFEESSLQEIVGELKVAASGISIKTIEQDRLPSNVELTQNLLKKNNSRSYYPTRSISEPIIINDYAYIFDKQNNAETLILFKRDKLNGWAIKCFIEFYLVITD
ncbi:hypothetical protein [Algoriphagus sp. CAU 1675]|uniref:hypothetical protein n=1 Tax=Algoriphagus sp. CAU 1675 TaxID=3032597 RepID=UPI0023DCB14E|nr:hypothetical protein [Algoriphagus sp. CAU 1675]MDF2156674.1 hypothetical protein [Algoriphagus sp. CAU 1675]